MFPTLVLAWTAPNESENQPLLLERVKRRIRKWNMDMITAIFNPTQIMLESALGKVPFYQQLVLTWISVPMEVPSWIFEVEAVRNMRGMHICSYRKNPIQKFSVSVPAKKTLSLVDRRRYWFADGWWVSPSSPYGMRRVQAPIQAQSEAPAPDIFRYNLVAGDSQQLDVVRLIFDMYSYQRQSVVDIVNLLRAEKISAGESVKDWSNPTVERVLTDPIYIGAYRYKTFLRYEAFPAVIEPWLYYVALARLYGEKKLRDRSVPLIGQSNDPVE